MRTPVILHTTKMSASTNFADLRLAEDKKAVLFDIKTSLSSVAMTDNSILSSETFGILFGCLSTTDRCVFTKVFSLHNKRAMLFN